MPGVVGLTWVGMHALFCLCWGWGSGTRRHFRQTLHADAQFSPWPRRWRVERVWVEGLSNRCQVNGNRMSKRQHTITNRMRNTNMCAFRSLHNHLVCLVLWRDKTVRCRVFYRLFVKGFCCLWLKTPVMSSKTCHPVTILWPGFCMFLQNIHMHSLISCYINNTF